MNLFDLTKEIFTYLVRFREQASTAAAPSEEQLRSELRAIFRRLEDHAKRQSSLVAPLEQVRYPLVALVDEVITTSAWEHAEAWSRRPLEMEMWGTSQGGSRFFELASKLDTAPRDVVAVYYLCLALGFTGEMSPDDPRLEALKQRLMARLPTAPELGSPRYQGNAHLSGRPRGLLWALAAAVALAGAGVGWWLWPAMPPPRSTPPPVRVARAPSAKAAPATTTPVTSPPATAAPAPAPPAAPKAPAPQPKPPAAPKQPAKAAAATPAPAAAAAPQAPAKAAKAPAPGPAYRVQAGVFVGPVQSGELAERLEQAGYPAMVVRMSRKGAEPWYVVVVQPLKGQEHAQQVQRELKDKFGLEGLVRELD